MGNNQDQERLEIFAVAAVGFALQHDLEFKKNFLRKFAGIEENAENFVPSLQAADCTDLKLENSKEHILVVVEFKVWAELQPKQNPWFDGRKSDNVSLPFWSEADNGYGYQLCQKNYSQFSTIYYTIVQQNTIPREESSENPWKSGNIFQLKIRSWKSLLGPCLIGLEEDLVNSLGELGIEELDDWHMKTMRIKPESIEDCFKGIKTIEILIWISEKLGLPLRLWRDFQGQVVGNCRYLGVAVPNNLSDRLEKRSEFVGTHIMGLGWFGYVSEDQQQFQPEVWFYCNPGMKPKLAETLKMEFKDNLVEFPKPPETDDPGNCVIIRRSSNSTEPDGNWFCKALGIES